MKLKILTQVVSLDDVVQAYVSELRGETIHSHEYLIDPAKGKLILQLYIEDRAAGGL